MSIPVPPTELAEAAQGRSVALLVSVGAEGRPKVAQIHPVVQGATVRCRVGPGTIRNLEGHPDVTVVWPPGPGHDDGFVLLADGRARPFGPGADMVVVEIEAAVLHRRPADVPEV